MSFWGFLGVIFLLTWCFTQALGPLFNATSVLLFAVLLDTLLRYVLKEKRSQLDWIVILPGKTF